MRLYTKTWTGSKYKRAFCGWIEYDIVSSSIGGFDFIFHGIGIFNKLSSAPSDTKYKTSTSATITRYTDAYDGIETKYYFYGGVTRNTNKSNYSIDLGRTNWTSEQRHINLWTGENLRGHNQNSSTSFPSVKVSRTFSLNDVNQTPPTKSAVLTSNAYTTLGDYDYTIHCAENSVLTIKLSSSIADGSHQGSASETFTINFDDLYDYQINFYNGDVLVQNNTWAHNDDDIDLIAPIVTHSDWRYILLGWSLTNIGTVLDPNDSRIIKILNTSSLGSYGNKNLYAVWYKQAVSFNKILDKILNSSWKNIFNPNKSVIFRDTIMHVDGSSVQSGGFRSVDFNSNFYTLGGLERNLGSRYYVMYNIFPKNDSDSLKRGMGARIYNWHSNDGTGQINIFPICTTSLSNTSDRYNITRRENIPTYIFWNKIASGS